MSLNKRTFVLLASLLVAACGKQSDGPLSTNTTATAEPAPVTAPTPLPVGKPGTASGVAVTVLSIGQRDRIGTSRRAAEGETFVTVRYDVKNLTTEPMSRGERPEVILRDPQGRAYAEDGAAGITLTEGGLADATTDTNPNMTARVTSVWKVDKASFDMSKWTLVVATDPALTFSLK